MLVAPVVHLQRRLLDGHPGDTLFQLAEEDHAGGVEVLVIHAVHQHEVAEHVFGDVLAPRHLLPRLESIAHLLQEELRLVVRQVAQRHVGVEELHGLALGAAKVVELQTQTLELRLPT